ncbi:hypothetical protein RclHR1_00880008 [Rhizophagus clarus]|uniref:F-box domain-containing protein n=1 Tax=Rhizophagus clarus TaxID=94130 RepID=A0A2Z6S2B1_9GLOM|nr:hypothetical protein RclHR1_00880008 [Rhizophagus clarus]
MIIKSTPQITPDCLEGIFEYLRNDRSSLFSCLLVNRLWCRLVVHLIWRDPFFCVKGYLSDIIQAYISCLPDTSKQIVINEISNTDEKTLQQLQQQQPLFNYIKYLQVFNSENFNIAFKRWYEKFNKPYENFNITKLLIDFIFKECSILTKLRIYVWDKWGIPLNKMNFDLLFNREKEGNCLINLKDFVFIFYSKTKSVELENSFQIAQNLFDNMEKKSNKIEFLEINFRGQQPPKKVDQSVGNLIKSQKNLKSCKFIEYWDPKDPSIYKLLLNNSSLTHLNLSLSYFHQSFFEGLLACKNLETLELSRCPEMPSHLVNFPSKGSFSIKHLKVVMNYPAFNESLIILLHMCNINLRKLFISGVDETIIDAICLYNTQLTHLSLLAQQTIFDPPQSLSVLKDLTHLKLANIQTYIFSEHTLTYFIDSLPSSLQHLYFNFNINTNSLKIFLNDCKIPLKSLEFHQSDNQDDEVFDSLVNYKKSNQNVCEEIRLFIEYPHTFSLNAAEEAKKHIKIILKVLRNHDLW